MNKDQTTARSPWVKPSFWPAATLTTFTLLVAGLAGYITSRGLTLPAVFLLLLAIGAAFPSGWLLHAYETQRFRYRAAVPGDAPWQMRSGR